MVYWPAGDDHACQDSGCIYAAGTESNDLATLRALNSLFKPLSPEELEKRTQAYREGGYLTRETLMRVLLGEFD